MKKLIVIIIALTVLFTATGCDEVDEWINYVFGVESEEYPFLSETHSENDLSFESETPQESDLSSGDEVSSKSGVDAGSAETDFSDIESGGQDFSASDNSENETGESDNSGSDSSMSETAGETFESDFSESDEHEHEFTPTIVPPTCISEGYTHFECSCGCYYNSNYTSKTEHNIENGICTVCKYVAWNITDISYFNFEEDGNGYRISAKDVNDLPREIYLPDHYIGKPIIAIKENAFLGSAVEKIEIPNTVTAIYDYAFSNCADLKEIILPDSLKSIKIGAFHFCSGLESITIPASVEYLGYSLGTCENLSQVIFEDAAGWTAELTPSYHDYEAVSPEYLKDSYAAAVHIKETYKGVWEKI